MNNAISILDIEPESIVDGIGIRKVIFSAGCNHQCYNCHNPQTWDINNGYIVPIQEIYEKLNITKNTKYYNGVTFSGGEPMLQAKAFNQLAKMIKNNSTWDIWVYTGYQYEDIIKYQDNRFELLQNIDVLVDGRYIHELRDTDLIFRGSSNQRIIDVQESLRQNNVVNFDINKF